MERDVQWEMRFFSTDWEKQHLDRLAFALRYADQDMDVMDDLAVALGMDPVTLADCFHVLSDALDDAVKDCRRVV